MVSEMERINTNNQEQALAPQAGAALSGMSVSTLLQQVKLVQEVMQSCMQDGQHYGKVPGCGDKPTLLKAGAEKLAFVFRLNPEFSIEERQLERGHREYRVTCTMKQIGSGFALGQGVGVCSTMEAKYRFRTGPTKLTDRPVPKAYWDKRQSDPKAAQALLGGPGFVTKKDESGQWVIAEQGEKVENDNPADQYNTVLKMAKKRAQVDATLTCTAASDIFTQDLEDIRANMDAAGVIDIAARAETIPQAPKAPAHEHQHTTAPANHHEPAKEEGHAPAPTEQGEDGKISWRAFMWPKFCRKYFGQSMGETAQQDPEGLAWWVKNYEPKPWQGRMNPADLAFRKALDDAQAELSRSENGTPDGTDDDVPY